MQEPREKVNCPFCLSPIEGNEEQIRCPVCGVAHHAECWQANGKCSVYGCDGWQSWSGVISDRIAPKIEDAIDIEDAQIVQQPTPRQDEVSLCIECGQPVKRGRLVCYQCRGDWRPGWLENCSGPMILMIGIVVGIISLIVKGLT